MSAQLLREAATLMRERAEAATPGRWEGLPPDASDEHGEGMFPGGWVGCPDSGDGTTFYAFIAEMSHTDEGPRDAEHIASWHPAVALAVAVWLDSHADIHALRTCDERLIVPCPAITVARAFLGRDS